MEGTRTKEGRPTVVPKVFLGPGCDFWDRGCDFVMGHNIALDTFGGKRPAG